MSWNRRPGVCVDCNRTMLISGKGRCATCLTRTYPPRVCGGCGESRPHAGHGLCSGCRDAVKTHGDVRQPRTRNILNLTALPPHERPAMRAVHRIMRRLDYSG
jgi:predicted amidophosphoribosyltransferase